MSDFLGIHYLKWSAYNYVIIVFYEQLTTLRKPLRQCISCTNVVDVQLQLHLKIGNPHVCTFDYMTNRHAEKQPINTFVRYD